MCAGSGRDAPTVSVAGATAVALVSAQLALTLVAQLFHRRAWISAFDRVAVLPLWRFFANGKGGQDWMLLIRDGNGAGEMGEWTLVEIAPARRWTSAVWNPFKHARGRLDVLLRTLAGRVATDPDATPATSRSFERLEAIVRAQPAATGASVRQFAIDEAYGGQRRRRAFVSPAIPLPDALS